MSDLEQARELLAAAERDLSALRGMGDSGIFADEIFGFHAQQAVEKSFKAWLAFLGEVYPLTHDLGELRAHDDSTSCFEGLIEYTPYAVDIRYAGAEPQRRPLDRGVCPPARRSAAGTDATIGRRRIDEAHNIETKGLAGGRGSWMEAGLPAKQALPAFMSSFDCATPALRLLQVQNPSPNRLPTAAAVPPMSLRCHTVQSGGVATAASVNGLSGQDKAADRTSFPAVEFVRRKENVICR